MCLISKEAIRPEIFDTLVLMLLTVLLSFRFIYLRNLLNSYRFVTSCVIRMFSEGLLKRTSSTTEIEMLNLMLIMLSSNRI
jgi:hypothetical protein